MDTVMFTAAVLSHYSAPTSIWDAIFFEAICAFQLTMLFPVISFYSDFFSDVILDFLDGSGVYT